jgi:hypothetical protein
MRAAGPAAKGRHYRERRRLLKLKYRPALESYRTRSVGPHVKRRPARINRVPQLECRTAPRSRPHSPHLLAISRAIPRRHAPASVWSLPTH